MVDVLNLLEPITYENLHELHPGEWIWDSKLYARRAHKKTIYNESIVEPIGFRQVHILDLKDFPRFSSKPFMLTSIDNFGFGRGNEWVHFEHGRFYKFINVITYEEDYDDSI